MPSDSGSRRAASGGALERRKTASASRTTTAATTRSVLRVRLFIHDGRERPSGITLTFRTSSLARDWILLEFSTDTNAATGDVHLSIPGCKTLLLHGYVVASGLDRNR